MDYTRIIHIILMHMYIYTYVCIYIYTCGLYTIILRKSPCDHDNLRTVVPIPVSISGLWGCPGYRKGGHVEVALPTVPRSGSWGNWNWDLGMTFIYDLCMTDI